MQNYRVASADSLGPYSWELQIMKVKLLAYIEYSKLDTINLFRWIKSNGLPIPVEGSKHGMKCPISKLFTFRWNNIL